MSNVVLIGGLGVIAETSEYHRAAFNMAFAKLKLAIIWSVQEYQSMLVTPGGLARVTQYLERYRPESVVLANTILILKNRIFIKLIESMPPTARPGFNSLMKFCKSTSTPIAIVSTTGLSNIRQLLKACSISAFDFSAICSKEQVQNFKPAPDIYFQACHTLNVDVEECIAIEDSESGIESAFQAKISCFAFLGENTSNHDTSKAQESISSLESVIPHLTANLRLTTQHNDSLLK